MITDFDDYNIHQSATPINQPSVTDRNFYDRYWFHGIQIEGKFSFCVAFGLYPHRFVQDGNFTVCFDGEQHSFHVSGRAPVNPADSSMGPMRIAIVRPQRRQWVVVEPNETGIECDLTFYANTVPFEEPKNFMFDGVRKIMDTCRLVQFGRWEGYISVKGRRFDVTRDTVYATRDKSWGVRQVGELEVGAPGKLSSNPGVFYIWSPFQFEDFCTLWFTREEVDGYPSELFAVKVQTFANEEIPSGEVMEDTYEIMAKSSYDVSWIPGTRWVDTCGLRLEDRNQNVYEFELETIPSIRLHMAGVGYQHPEWRHGAWQGEHRIGSESWKTHELAPEEFQNIHSQNMCHAKIGKHRGIGIFETVSLGPHKPSGFTGYFDGYRG